MKTLDSSTVSNHSFALVCCNTWQTQEDLDDHIDATHYCSQSLAGHC